MTKIQETINQIPQINTLEDSLQIKDTNFFNVDNLHFIHIYFIFLMVYPH